MTEEIEKEVMAIGAEQEPKKTELIRALKAKLVAAVKDAENWHKGADSRLEKIVFEDPDGATKKVCKQLMDSGELDWVTQSTLSDSAKVLLDLHDLVKEYALKSTEVLANFSPSWMK